MRLEDELRLARKKRNLDRIREDINSLYISKYVQVIREGYLSPASIRQTRRGPPAKGYVCKMAKHQSLVAVCFCFKFFFI
jgi:hypothetical protein